MSLKNRSAGAKGFESQDGVRAGVKENQVDRVGAADSLRFSDYLQSPLRRRQIGEQDRQIDISPEMGLGAGARTEEHTQVRVG